MPTNWKEMIESYHLQRKAREHRSSGEGRRLVKGRASGTGQRNLLHRRIKQGRLED